MEAQPSPQSVGREFVRQYYTLLNKAPEHLHRFYNNSSSFLHEGVDGANRDVQMVIGQKQIHNRILQLNFRDCHAKISQVDAQATLGNGVVVQVTGELSNAGQPMRRFTQTFVLAAQAPKKYYVHNDIFRYQDYYTDDEVEENGRSDAEEEPADNNSADHGTNPNVLSQTQTPAGPQTIYYQSNVMTAQSNNIYQQPPPPVPPMNGLHDEVVAPVVMQTMLAQPPPPIMDNNLVVEEEKPFEKDDSLDAGDNYDDDRQDGQNAYQQSSEPKTYANLVKSGGVTSGTMSFASSIGQTATVQSLSPPPVQTAKFSQQPVSDIGRFDPPLGAGGAQQKPLPQRQMRERRTSNSNVPNIQQQFGDSHQLFLGNIPHHASEEELRSLFGRFGTIADLRILSKQGPKIPGQRPPPNYGFITYEDAASVQECLANLPLYFPDNAPDGQKLNVEEKKTRTRAPGETGGRIGGGNNFGMSNNGPRQMGGGGGGGMPPNRNNGPNNGPMGGGPRGGNQQRQPFNPNRGGGTFNRSDRNDRSGSGGGGSSSTNTFVNNRR